MHEMILTGVVAFVAALAVVIVVKIGPWFWRLTQRLNWRISRWREDRRYAKEQCLNEAVVLTNGENRHRGCVRRGQEIDEREPGTYIPLGPCTVCGVHARSPRDTSKSYRQEVSLMGLADLPSGHGFERLPEPVDRPFQRCLADRV